MFLKRDYILGSFGRTEKENNNNKNWCSASSAEKLNLNFWDWSRKPQYGFKCPPVNGTMSLD